MLKNAKPGHKTFTREHQGFSPVILSSKHFEGIMYRSQQQEKQQNLAAFQEQQRYRQYLKEGGEVLMGRFKKVKTMLNDEVQLQIIRDKALEAATKDQESKRLQDELRKERIVRANEILKFLKPGPRVLHGALLQSEVMRQRKANEIIDAEIVEEAKREERLADKRCPTLLVPFGNVTEQQEKDDQLKKKQEYRDYFAKELEDRRVNRLAQKEQDEVDGIIEREQYNCLRELENKAAKELKRKKQEACRSAYQDALVEKAERAKYNRMSEEIDDRINCVHRVVQRNLGNRYKKQMQDTMTNTINKRHCLAMYVSGLQQRDKRAEKQAEEEERNEAEIKIDEERRLCEIRTLAEQRKAYQKEEAKLAELKAIRDLEVRRFEMARRLRNDAVNKKFAEYEKAKIVDEKTELRQILHGQRERFIEQRQEELMRITACDEDPYLVEDVNFFADTVAQMDKAKRDGRPLYPLARAAELYKRENQVDMVPEGRMVKRNKLRDYCWPGYFSKADLAYRKYEHREKCRQKQNQERHSIFTNCIKITNMAAGEAPYKPCVAGSPIKCLHHRIIPGKDKEANLEVCQDVCTNYLPVEGISPAKNKEVTDQSTDITIGTIASPRITNSILTTNSALMAHATRIYGGKNSVALGSNESATKIQKSAKKMPDLTRCWTAKPTKPMQQKEAHTSLDNSTRQIRSGYVWPKCPK